VSVNSYDDTVIEMRARGCTWAAIGAELFDWPGSCCNRFKSLKTLGVEVGDDERQPLPPGHPATWGAICDAPFPTPERIH
jgi:hypothetical protein